MVRYDEGFFQHQADGSERSARLVLEHLFDLYRPESILDIGCGVGTWLQAAQSLGVKDILGVDGADAAHDVPRIDKSRILLMDLNQPISVGRRFDLVMSLEVAEHLPGSSARAFVDNLTRHGDLVLFSAALPFQGGFGHVNENWLEYWAKLFEHAGFEPLDILRRTLWHNTDVEWWYRQNMILFRRRTKADVILAGHASEPAMSTPHPELFLRNQRFGNPDRYRTDLDRDIAYWRAPVGPPPGYGPEFAQKENKGPADYAALKASPPETLPATLRDAIAPITLSPSPEPLVASRRGPDFLCIGVQKAATTWLFDVLHSHKDIFAPPGKEMNFFNRRVFPPGAAWSGEWASANSTSLLRNYLERKAEPNPYWLRLLVHLMEREVDQAWYEHIFAKWGRGRLCGECTPGYALLPETEISQILQFNPEIRIILLLRDPVERALSALQTIGAHAPEAVPFMDQIIEEPSFVARGLYQDFVPRWMSLVPADQLLIARSEQISRDPQAFIDRLSAFLGVDPTGFNPTRVKGRHHVGSKDVLIPDAIKDTLEQKFALSRAYLEEVAPMS